MKKILLTTLIFAVVIGIWGLVTKSVEANPSQILTQTSAPATTTLSYITPGAATTTVSFDTQQDGAFPADYADLFVWYNASSSSGSILNVNIQYSPDNTNWYEAGSQSDLATTTLAGDITVAGTYKWSYSSSSPDLVGNATISASTRMIEVKTPVRYVRAIFWVPVGAKNGAVWSEWTARKQTR